MSIRRVRALFERAGYSAAGIAGAGIEIGLGVRAPDVPALERALDTGDPLATLIRLFLLSRAVRAVEFERRLGADAEILLEAGFVERRTGRVQPMLAVTPWRGGLVAHDPDPPGPLWPTHVAGPGPATETLAQLVIPGQVDAALDLGTGSGALALLAARQAARVVATDVNPVALERARATALLNGIETIEARSGSLFEPLAEERFGLVLANPPFVIAPDHELLFRHSPLPRDALSRTVVEGAAAHLADGGTAVVLCNWVRARGEAAASAVEAWTAGRGCDALVLVHGVEDPLAYAVRWNQRTQQVAPESYGDLLDRWLTHARREGIEAIVSGAVVLRKRSGSSWFHALALHGETRGDAGEHVLAVLRGLDELARHPHDGELRRRAYRLRIPHRLDQALVAHGDGYAVEPGTLALASGLALPVTVEPDLVPVVLRLDGSLSIDAIAAEIAAETGRDTGPVAERAVAFVRTLLERGLAEPADRATGAVR